LIGRRKDEHIILAVKENVEFRQKTTFLEDVELIHNSVPELNLKNIDVKTEFLGYELNAPILISGMTGGTSLAEKMNRILAKAASKVKVAIGVGSQRVMLKDPKAVKSFKVIRDEANDVPIIGNIGASQVVEGLSDSDIDHLIEPIKADAIAVHLNPLQESLQLEGEPNYLGFIDRLKDFMRRSPIPIIAKETGAGISKEAAAALIQAGVKGIDVGGAGGTSFSVIEGIRSRLRGDEVYENVARTFSEWGIPLAASILEVRNVSADITLVATGGIRNGLDVAKALRLGADMCGIALPAIRAAYYSGVNGVIKLLERYILELKIALFLTGSGSISDLREKPIVIYGKLRDWIERRKLDLR